MATTLSLNDIYRPIRAELDQIRDAVSDLFAEALQLVQGVPVPRPNLGGKMMRPALCLLSAGAVGANDVRRFVPLGAAMELLHLAALAHDDVLDGAMTRRGHRSLNALWDNHAAVLGGDYLVARAISLMGDYNTCAVITNAIDSVRQMAEGELAFFGHGRRHQTLESCISLAKLKTASLFAVTCSTPTYLVDTTHRDALHEFGMSIGIAFQIIDDLLDLAQPESTLGKPSCGDLVEGKQTVPVLFMREALDEPGRARLDTMQGRELTVDDRGWVADTLEATGARSRTECLARQYVDEAAAQLDRLPGSPYRDAMAAMAEFVLVRVS